MQSWACSPLSDSPDSGRSPLMQDNIGDPMDKILGKQKIQLTLNGPPAQSDAIRIEASLELQEETNARLQAEKPSITDSLSPSKFDHFELR